MVDCQDASEPNLSQLDILWHRCIVLDEADWLLVLNCKVLLQSGVEGSILYQSKCQQHSRWYNLYMMPIIISTNNWIPEERHKIKDHPTNWLRDNSFVIRLGQDKMYE